MCRCIIFVVLAFTSIANAQGDQLKQYLQDSHSDGALFSGTVAGMKIYAVLRESDQGEHIVGFYFYDKFNEAKSSENGAYSYRPIKLKGNLRAGPDGEPTLSLNEFNGDAVIAKMQARFSEEEQQFVGNWHSAESGNKHSFTLKAGGRLPIYSKPDVDLIMSPTESKLVLEDNTSIKIDSYQFSDAECYDCNESYSFSVLEGNPRIFAVKKHYSGGRVESVDTRYIVEGETDAFASASEGGNHWCAGGTGGRGNHSVSYDPPYFDITHTSSSWDHCETEDGYFTDLFKRTTARYVVQKDGGANHVEPSDEAEGQYASLVLRVADGTSIFFELTDSNLLWGGHAPSSDQSYEVFEFGQGSTFDFKCWLYGDGTQKASIGSPDQDNIDPAWRNLDPETSWEHFVTHTRHGLLSTKAWTFTVNQNEVKLKLHGLEVARFDKVKNQCYSLYLKEDSEVTKKLTMVNSIFHPSVTEEKQSRFQFL